MVSIEEWKKKFLITKWRDIPVYGKEDSVCQSFPVNTFIYRFNAISDKIPASYFMHIGKVILKFIWRDIRSRIANTTLKEKNKSRCYTT